MRAIFVFIFVATFTAPIYGGYQLLGLSQPFGASSAKGLNTAEFAGSADEYWPDDCEPRRSSQWRWPSPESNVGFRYLFGSLACWRHRRNFCLLPSGRLSAGSCLQTVPAKNMRQDWLERGPSRMLDGSDTISIWWRKKAGMPLVREIAETG